MTLPSIQLGRSEVLAAITTRPVLYATMYPWILLVASLDVMLTTVVLTLGGVEANPLAAAVLQWGGVPAMTAYKFALIFFVILICEIVGTRTHSTGRRLAEWAVALNAIPVTFALALLAVATHANAA